jgi:hypothetical protein
MGPEERKAEAQRPVDEAGGGVSEGFELAEQELIEHATHGDMRDVGHILSDAPDPENGHSPEGGESDHEYTSEAQEPKSER